MNWGRILILTFLTFAAFIIYFVIRMIATPTPTVANDYYEQGLNYQQEIDARERAESQDVKLSVVKPRAVLMAISAGKADSGSLRVTPIGHKAQFTTAIFTNTDSVWVDIPAKWSSGFFMIESRYFISGKAHSINKKMWLD